MGVRWRHVSSKAGVESRGGPARQMSTAAQWSQFTSATLLGVHGGGGDGTRGSPGGGDGGRIGGRGGEEGR